ncbi:IS110 family transposase [Paraburkholderia madseniana]|jgi:transposase|uniref:IS110 family transposase n=1 Tax=Paraburkholderia madseniana TaxID=2599607 RepID=A0AAP5BM68_9BURK|nr:MULTISPECIES: IS110 family transposase [Paraburkholderia]MBK5122292.1 IS110 family transposase [Burkholderia sp. R-69980]MCX4152400.1 IS110 family transposase [Paraburkholderia madseniana]MDN7155328.1 IS110 family transposase [Paraburkholderia sp. WS6]MDQ6414211.1 IS110 family transposase [Paraburkholderia madseniana]NPT65204.1 IS110 family transposase [Paraburkholderia madseniana]
MDKITRVGVDLAKNVMQLHAVDCTEHVVVRRAIARERFVSWFANLEPCLVAMEACSAAHYWARKLRALGHDVRLIPPQFAAPYRKGGARVKNDAVDAEAICEAASRPHMRFVPIKTPAQQSVLVLHRMRTGFIEERTALVNRLRGLLAEFGVFLPQGIHQLRKHFVDRVEDGSNELAAPAREALMHGLAQWQALDDEIAWLDTQIARHVSDDPQAQRCMKVCGVGRLTASAAVATVIDARQFKNGRQMAAWIGLVPKQNSSGGKPRLGRITRQGNDYLRSLLYQGARSAIQAAHRHDDRLSRWIVQLQARIGYHKTLVAVANKHARILWAVLAKGEHFDPAYVCARAAAKASG